MNKPRVKTIHEIIKEETTREKNVLDEYLTKGFKELPPSEAMNKYTMIYGIRGKQQWEGTYKKGSIPDKFDDDFIQLINSLSKNEENYRQLSKLTTPEYRRVYDGIQGAVEKKLYEYKTPEQKQAVESELTLQDYYTQIDKLSEYEFEAKVREILDKYNSIVDEKNRDSISSISISPIYHLTYRFFPVFYKIVSEKGIDDRLKKNIVKPLISILHSTETEMNGLPKINGRTKGEVAKILGKMNAKDAFETLINLLNNTRDLDTQEGCIRGLGDLQDKRGLIALRDFKNKHNYLHNVIDEAIKKIS